MKNPLRHSLTINLKSKKQIVLQWDKIELHEHSKNLITLLLALKNSKVAFLSKTFFPKAHVYLHFVKWNKGNLKRRYPQNVLTFCLVQTLCCYYMMSVRS